MRIFRNKKLRKILEGRNRRGREIDPHDVLSDFSNLTESDLDRMEGRLILPIERSSYIFLFSIFIIAGLFAVVRLGNLQLVQGFDYAKRSATNSLQKTIVFANRGIIFDRNGDLLASNEPPVEVNGKLEVWSERKYATSTGLSTLLGYISYPKVDSKGNFYDTNIFGKDGAEEYFDDVLAGKNGTLIEETDARGKIVSQSAIDNPRDGTNVTLSIDKNVQNRMYEELKNLANERGYAGGAGVIMDINSGEILALASYPEFDSQIMANGKDRAAIASFLLNKHNPFLDRAVQGLYIPGSIVKPYLAIGALEEKIVDPEKQFLANGQITVPNPYDKAHPTIFKDWKVHGLVDMRKAIAVSSNVYFFTIGAGYEGQRGLGIANIQKYMNMFGFGSKTGVEVDAEESGNIPSPIWKAKTFPNDPTWRLGDTYNSSIGQYGYLVTPIQAVRAVSAIANGGYLVSPTIVKRGVQNAPLEDKLNEKGESLKEVKKETLPVAQENLQIVREGMRKGVLEGTAVGLNIPQVVVAAKTGTAELGVTKESVNSWTTGFFPYDKPRFAFAIAMEKGSRSNTVGSTYAMRRVLEWMSIYTPQYLRSE
ncbi:MAG: penicillin-binding transpeptidase domain-containing protein [Minisyncoccia bacterium]